jgi:peptide/nickel transport system permease protein
MRTIVKHAIRIVLVLLLGGLAGVTLVRIAPGFGVDEEELDSRLNSASHEALRTANGQKENLAHFYVGYCSRMLHGDLGTSSALNEPVRQLLAERIPDTAKSIGVGLALAWALGLGLAMLSVLPPTRGFDWLGITLSSAVVCIPAAILALAFVMARAPGRLAVGLIVFPKVFQFSRNLLARSASMPHVLTARAKGLGEIRILIRHILPVTATQLLALAGMSVCLALGACIPVEVLCDLPGIGQLAWKAALSRDLPLLVNLTMLVTLVTLIASTGSDLVSNAMHRRDA